MTASDNSRAYVVTVEDLQSLDRDEVLEGYEDGFEGWPCGDNRSRSYWHGWRNGRVDGGHAALDYYQHCLAHAFYKHERQRALN